MSEISVDSLDTFREFHTWMTSVDEDYTQVSAYVSREVCNTSGFTGVLEPLHEALAFISEQYEALTNLANSKWGDAANAVFATGRLYDLQDGQVSQYFDRAPAAAQAEQGPQPLPPGL